MPLNINQMRYFVFFGRLSAGVRGRLRSKSVRKALLRSGPGLQTGVGSAGPWLWWPGIPLSFGLAVALS